MENSAKEPKFYRSLFHKESLFSMDKKKKLKGGKKTEKARWFVIRLKMIDNTM